MPPRSTITVIAPATAQVVTVNELKEFARIENDDEDGLLDSFILAATACAENYTRRSFLTQTLRASIDASCGRGEWFPGHYDLPVDYFDSAASSQFELTRGPVRSVVGVSTYDQYGAATAFAAENYAITGDRFALAYGISWPSLLRPSGGIQIDYVAGYGDTSDDVPRPIRTAIQIHAASLYETRGQCGCDAPPAGCMMMLQQYRAMGL